MGAPCNWLVERCGCSTECWTKYKPATRTRAEALAVHWMWAATGRRYGLCEVTVRPGDRPREDPLYQEFGPATLSVTPGCGCAGQDCGIDLPGPVDSIVEVLIDGDPLAPDVYGVFDRRTLVRYDGECWQSCQTWTDEIPGLQVTYMRGVAVPDAVQYATEQLACQLAKGCEGGEDCTLPQRMRSLTRQGVTLDVATEEATSQGGRLRTGIKAVDDVVMADNPYGLTERPRVSSLDMPQHRVATWGGGS